MSALVTNERQRGKVYSNTFIKQKINYIHNNPVIEKIVANPEDYVFSSARNYADLDNELDIIPVLMFQSMARTESPRDRDYKISKRFP